MELDEIPNIRAYYRHELDDQINPIELPPICDRDPKISILKLEIAELWIHRADLDRAISTDPRRPLETIRLIDGPTALIRVQKTGQLHPREAQDWLRFNLESNRIRGWDALSPENASVEEIGPNSWPPPFSFRIDKSICDTRIDSERGFDTVCMDKSNFEKELKKLAEEASFGSPEASVTKNSRDAGRKRHKSYGPVMAMAGAWLKEQDYSAGAEITAAVLTQLRKAMEYFAQYLEDEEARVETPGVGQEKENKAPSRETIRNWSHTAIEAHRRWRAMRTAPKN